MSVHYVAPGQPVERYWMLPICCPNTSRLMPYAPIMAGDTVATVTYNKSKVTCGNCLRILRAKEGKK